MTDDVVIPELEARIMKEFIEPVGGVEKFRLVLYEDGTVAAVESFYDGVNAVGEVGRHYGSWIVEEEGLYEAVATYLKKMNVVTIALDDASRLQGGFGDIKDPYFP